MTQGFYEQLESRRGATPVDLRRSYSRVMAQLVARRKTIVEKGGDPCSLELAMSKVDEAWEVLSDDQRRRKYDALLDFGDYARKADSEVLWEKVASTYVEPVAVAGSELLNQTTSLELGELPGAMKRTRMSSEFEQPVDPTLIPHPEDEATKTMPAPVQLAPTPAKKKTVSVQAPPLPRPSVSPNPPNESRKAVTPAVSLREAEPKMPVLSPETVRGLMDVHGYSGALLQAVREARRMTLDDLSASTNISKSYLEAIESDAYDRLPAATFVRGYVRVLGSTLGLNEEDLVAGYMKSYSK